MSELTSMLARHEGIRLLVYDDATDQPITQGTLVHGHPTIGIGRALDVHGITPDEAEYLLSNDVDDVVASLRKEFYWYTLLNGPRQDAIADSAALARIGLPALADSLPSVASSARGVTQGSPFGCGRPSVGERRRP